ncbi:MAG: 30S ribosomal protein S7 [Eubacteriaceae bacterium]|nr:30S ribosomal protein S7 [Eubacteriaceae bacterium]
MTGGIGSGKSEAAKYLNQLGAAHLDADEISRALTGPDGVALPEIRRVFGDAAFDADGALDRASLGRLVFGNEPARRALERIIHPLVQRTMLEGKKGVAQKIVYGAFEKVAEKTGKEALEAFQEAIANITPALEVKARRVGGATYQVPIEIRADRKQALALRWLVTFARERNERTMIDRLAGEIMDARNNTGGAVKRKETMHAMAEANKAFAHFRW